MKRLIILTIFYFTQTFSDEHLKFLGFPINGTVNEYAAKLISKGFRISQKNKYASKGLRVMEGPFLDNIEEFGLHYDPNTKKMWSVTFVRNCFTEEEAKELYDKLESLIREKHFEATYKTDIEKSYIYSCSFKSDWGIISLGIKEYDFMYLVNMTYCDRINYIPIYKKKHQRALNDM